jgi:general stress protein 26
MTQPKRAERGDLDALYQRLKEFDTAMFTTVSKEGFIHSRPMMTQEREPDADLWFVTSSKTLKVEELASHPKVGIIYFRDRDKAYISLAGTAHIIANKDLIARKWKESWRAWFPEGIDSPDLVMIKVDVHEAEYWEPEGGQLRVMFEMARGVIKGEHPEINPPERVRVADAPQREFSDPV